MNLYPISFIKIPDKNYTIRIYPIKPIGLLTGDVEALSSYITRVANAHWVSPSHLCKELIEHYLHESPCRFKSDSRIDTMSKLSQQLCLALELGSPLELDFGELTLQSWGHAIDIKSRGKCFSNQRWCDACLREFESNGIPLHYKLYWMLSPVEICEIHKMYLSSLCPNCNSNQSYISSNKIPGHCQFCGSKIFAFSSSQKLESITPKQMWLSETCKDLIAFSRGGNFLRLQDFKFSVKQILNRYFFGEFRRIARELNLPQDFARAWLTKYSPSFSHLVDFCQKINTPPSILFSRTGQLIEIKKAEPTKSTYKQKRYLSKSQISDIKRKLKTLLKEDGRITTTTEIASTVGITRRMLCSRFPEESKKIIERVKKRRQLEKEERDAKRISRIKNRADFLVSQNIYPGQRQILKDKSILPSDIRIAKVKKALREIQIASKIKIGMI